MDAVHSIDQLVAEADAVSADDDLLHSAIQPKSFDDAAKTVGVDRPAPSGMGHFAGGGFDLRCLHDGGKRVLTADYREIVLYADEAEVKRHPFSILPAASRQPQGIQVLESIRGLTP